MSGVNGFGYSSIGDTVGRGTAAADANLRSFSATMDPGNTADMIKMQNLTQQWSVAVTLESNLVKTIGDALKGIVQKIG
jgi:type III secretion apparatus needle protein